MGNAEGWDVAKTGAAMKGFLADQKQVLIFQTEEGGHAALYKFTAPFNYSIEDVHANLLADGVAFHTLRPTGHGTDVYVADLDGSAHDAVDKASGRYDAQVEFQRGRAEFLGTTKQDGTDREQRDDARRAYAEIISQSPVPGSQELWRDIHTRWGETLGLGEHPEVTDVTGDEWNKSTAARLEREYQAVRPELAALARSAEGKSIEAEGIEPASWDTIGDALQEKIEQEFKESSYSSVYDSEVNNWYEENATQDAKYEAANGNDDSWVVDALEELRGDRAEAEVPEIPYTDQQLSLAISISYEHEGELQVDFDDTKLQEPKGLDTDPLLPGFEKVDPSTYLTKDMRTAITDKLKEAFETEAQYLLDHGKIDPPDYLGESANEYINDMWEQKSDDEKFEYGKNNTSLLDDNDDVDIGKIEVDELPEVYDPIQETDDENYQRTQKLARYMSIERASQVIRDRGLSKLEPNELHGAVIGLDNKLWTEWKAQSISPGGRLIQLATADELGGRYRSPINLEGAEQSDRKVVMQNADQDYKDIGGYAGVKAYIRGKWETTQFLLDKSHHQTLQLYRSVNLNNVFPDTKNELVQTESGVFVKFPDIDVQRNGAQSTSLALHVANDWSSHSNGVVLRAVVPRTAVLSVPAYGINITHEREVVIAGTAWQKWSAWKNKAPSFEEYKEAA